jgi:polysaccharide biosynthesis transport protein
MDGEFSLRRHRALIRRGLRWVVALTLCGMLVALAVNQLSPRLYESRVRIVVGPVPIVARPDINDLLAAQRVASTFADLAQTTRFLDEVRARLGLTESVEDLRERIISLAPPESSFIDVFVRDRDPETAARIANDVATALVQAAPEGIPNEPGGEPVPRQLSIWDRAVAATVPSSPRVLMNLLVGTLAGLIAGVGLAYARGYLRDEVVDAEDLEQLTGVAILGELRSSDVADAHVAPMALARLTKRLELLGGPPSRLLIASIGDGPAGWVGEEVAAQFAGLGRSTLILRLDAEARQNVASGSGLDALLTGAVDARAVTESGGSPGLRRVRPSVGTEAAAELATGAQMTAAMEALSKIADVVILTGDAPTESFASLIAAPQMTAVILVAGFERTKRREASAVASTLRSVGAPLAGLVLMRSNVKPGSEVAPRSARTVIAPAADRPAPR